MAHISGSAENVENATRLSSGRAKCVQYAQVGKAFQERKMVKYGRACEADIAGKEIQEAEGRAEVCEMPKATGGRKHEDKLRIMQEMACRIPERLSGQEDRFQEGKERWVRTTSMTS